MKNFTSRAVALFAMTVCMAVFSVVAKALPNPTTTWKDLNVIDTVQVNFQMTAKEGGWIAMDVNSLLEHTGVSIAEASANLGQVMYMWKYDNSYTAEDFFVSDVLSPLGEKNWWSLVFADDAKTTFVAGGWTSESWGWTGGDVVLNEEGIFWLWLAPYGGAEAGQKVHSQFYAIIGNDAILWNVDVEVLGQPMRLLEECTIKGETTIYTNNQVGNGWNGRTVTWNLQEALDSLGCGRGDINFFCLDSDGYLNPNFTATKGFWMTPEGEIAPYEYGTKTWFVELKDDGMLNVGQMPEAFVGDGTEICYGEVYIGWYDLMWKINVTMKVIPNREVATEFVEKGGGELYLQGLANYDQWSTGYNVHLDYEKALEVTECELGDELVLYAKKEDGTWTKEVSTTVAAGFWMTADGYFCWYGSGNAYFFENVNNGIIGNWGHVPNADDPGTTYTGEFYLVNEANGYYYTVHYRIDFVSEIVETAVVGEEDVTVVASDDGTLTGVDITPALTALGIEETEIPEEARWVVPSFATLYDQVNYMDEGYAFDAEGKTCNVDTEEGAAAAIYRLGYDAQEGGFYAEAWQDFAEGASYTVKMALEYEGKYYVYNITVVAPSGEEDAIVDVNVSKKAFEGKAYNVSGQPVDGSYRGFVIKNGKLIRQ